MSGFDDLIPEAMPYIKMERISGTAGTSWSMPYNILDATRTPIDLSTGFTVTWRLYPLAGGAALLDGDVDVTVPGLIDVTVAPDVTANLMAGEYAHELVITRDSDAARIVAVGARGTKFNVGRKVG